MDQPLPPHQIPRSPAVSEPAPGIAPDSSRHSVIIQVVLISTLLGALSGALAAGGIYLAATRNPEIAESLKPFSDLLANIQTRSTDKAVTQVTLEESSAVTSAVGAARPAVVSIIGTVQVRSFFFNQLYENDFAGTGFIIDREEGLVLTNRHVVSEGNATYRMITYQGEEISFTNDDISIDPANDLAVIKVSFPTDLDIGEISLGDSSTLVPGQQVIAIGNALGKFDNTVTVGVVSALGRQINAGSDLGSSQELLIDVIQTDAAINQGNSGGPLLNSLGQVIGINSAISATGENIGFAIPIDGVKIALESYLENGRIIRPWLGVQYTQLTKDISQANDLPVEEGAYLQVIVPGGPAEEAGLKAGDIVISIGGTAVTAEDSIIKLMQTFQVGDEVDVRLLRPDNANADDPQYNEETITVTLAERPSSSR